MGREADSSIKRDLILSLHEHMLFELEVEARIMFRYMADFWCSTFTCSILIILARSRAIHIKTHISIVIATAVAPFSRKSFIPTEYTGTSSSCDIG